MKQALLVIDVQNDYFKDGKMALHLPEQALVNINTLEDVFIERQLPIIYIQHVNEQANAPFFEVGTNGVLLHEALKINQSSHIVEKHYPNSFLGTTLKTLLDSLEIKQLVITGMMTHMCIDSTTRASREFGYNPILISDATATRALEFNQSKVTAEQVQHSFLSSLTNFAQVMTTKSYMNLADNNEQE